MAVDTSACAHATPTKVFSKTIEETKASKAGACFYGADSSPILNMGAQTVKGEDGNGTAVEIPFEVASKLTRPLASVYEMTEQDNKAVFWKGGGCIETKDGKRMPLRMEGKLWFLDIWVQVPSELAKPSTFVRPS